MNSPRALLMPTLRALCTRIGKRSANGKVAWIWGGTVKTRTVHRRKDGRWPTDRLPEFPCREARSNLPGSSSEGRSESLRLFDESVEAHLQPSQHASGIVVVARRSRR